MEFQFSLIVCVIIINILDFYYRRDIFDDLCNLAETIFINNMQNLTIEDIEEFGISLAFDFWIPLVNPK